MHRIIATGSRIQSTGINFDESTTYPTTTPATAATIRYVHKCWCSPRMAASCSSPLFKRRLYSLAGVSFPPLFKAVDEPALLRRTNSNSVIPHHLPPGTRSLVLGQTKAGHDHPYGGMRLTSGGTTGRRSVGGAERAEKASVDPEL